MLFNMFLKIDLSYFNYILMIAWISNGALHVRERVPAWQCRPQVLFFFFKTRSLLRSNPFF